MRKIPLVALCKRVHSALAHAMRRWLAPGPVYYLLMLAAFLGVFLLIPLTIFAYSGEDWHFQPVLLLKLGGIGLLALLGAALIVRLVAAVHPRTAAGLAVGLFCLGLFAIGAHVYAPLAIGPLDGSDIVSPEPLAYSAIELLVLVVLLFAFSQLVRGRGLRIAGWFAVLLLVITAGYLATAERPSHAHSRKVQASHTRPPQPGNVYQIVLDTFQTDAFLTVLEHRPDLRRRLQGFQIFPKNVSNYTTTRQSAASYFTSTFYTGDKYSKWLWSWRNRGQFKELAQAGYQISMYAPFGDWDNRFTSKYRYNVDFYEQKFEFVGSAFHDFLQIWLLSLTPNVLTNEAVQPTAALSDRLFKLLANRDAPLSIERGIQPYSGVLMLEQLVDVEKRRPPNGQYVYAHAALPHGPFVFDRDCHYQGRQRGSVAVWQAYVDQGNCAVLLLVHFLDRLVELGRYDSATIVVHADTGHGLSPTPAPTGPAAADGPLGFDNGRLLSSVAALLMVKRPFAHGDLTVVDRPVQLVDVFPTLLDLLKLKAPAYQLRGRSLYSGDGEQRQALFGLDPKTKHGSGIIELRIDDPSDLTHSPVTVLGPATDPATWSGQAADTTIGGRPAVTLRDEPQ